MIVNNELERMWKEAVVTSLRYYSKMCLDEGKPRESVPWLSFELDTSRIQVRELPSVDRIGISRKHVECVRCEALTMVTTECDAL
jgi:hypothetical protein